MSNNRLILRNIKSPWTVAPLDITKNSVLSWADLDNNFIFLKGETLSSGEFDEGFLKLKKVNGDVAVVSLVPIVESIEDVSDIVSENSNVISVLSGLTTQLSITKADDADISVVGKTGQYGDLLNKPDLSVLEEVLVFGDLSEFPVAGETQKVYIAEDTGYIYRWSGTEYIQLTDQTAIWGQISGSLSGQTDLQMVLDSKANETDLQAVKDNVNYLVSYTEIEEAATMFDFAYQITSITPSATIDTFELSINGGAFSTPSLPLTIPANAYVIFKIEFESGEDKGVLNIKGTKQ